MNRYRIIIPAMLILLQGCAAQSQLISDVEETVTYETLEYYLYYPKGYEEDEATNYPLLLFLHGGGESGGELSMVKTNGPPKLIARGKEFPFLILAPQNPHARQWWNTRAVKQLLDTVVANNRVDTNRVYLTGLSRGGGAAWEMAVQYPDTFAALAVVCGMAPVPYASWINKKMGIWVFHGTEDQSIPITESESMVRRLREMGYDVRFTRYEGVGHNAWERAYSEEELYDWLMEQEFNNSH